MHNCDDPFWPLSVQGEGWGEVWWSLYETRSKWLRRNGIRLTSPAARDARDGLSLVKERLKDA